MEKPKLSVCVPAYNAAEFIKKTIDSILAQTYSDFELIIIDNASTDNTFEILKKYTDKRITLFRNSKNILSENWNKCISKANGEYIALFHADDIYEPTIIEKQVSILDKKPEVGAVFASANLINTKDEKIGEKPLSNWFEKKNLSLDLDDILKYCVSRVNDPFVCSSCIARTQLYKKVGQYNLKDFKWAFDFDMYFRFLEHMNIAILDEKLINYRLSPIQASIRIETSRTCADEFYLVLDKYLESKIHIFNSLTLKKYKCYKVYGNLVTPALNFLSAGNDIEAKRLLRNALFLDWFLLSFIDFRLCKYLLTTIVFFFASYTNLYKPLIKLRNSFIIRRHH